MDQIKAFLLSILEWIGHSVFRLFTVILLCILGFVGWFIHSEKDSLMASYRAQQSMPKMNGQYEQAVNFILKNSDAELVAVFQVNTLLNTRKLIYLTSRSAGHDTSHDNTNVGLLTKNLNNNEDVVGLMSGKIPCGEYAKPQSYIGFTYKAAGVTYMCRISVPADPGLFIGQISVGWKEPPTDVEIAKTVLIVASSLLFDKK